ncbi:MAG: hypothetical protein COB69_08580 [Phycisphaera sp.]|nr:MAG: hypothetical protein COB69_08580 [Phycisphaera sp.]
MKNKKQMTALLVAFAASTASADILNVSASASGLAGGSSANGGAGATYTADLPQFDPALGTLTSVELAITAEHAGTFDMTSHGTGGGYIIFYIDYSFEVNGFGGTDGNLLLLDWVTEPTSGSPFGSAPGHFNAPFTPVADGATVSVPFGTQLNFADTYSDTDTEFSQFIGTGTLPFDIVDWAVFSLATTGSDVSWELSSFANLTVDATYTFTPIPAPGALALLAVSGLMATRRRR